jgi:hypothetical protein
MNLSSGRPKSARFEPGSGAGSATAGGIRKTGFVVAGAIAS